MKRTGNVKNKKNNYILLLSLLAQLLFITASSPVYGGFDKASVYKAAVRRTTYLSYKYSQMGYYLLTLNDKLPVAEIESNKYFIFKITGDAGYARYYHHINTLSALGLSVIILYFGHVIIRNNRYKELIALKLGGHDPPVRLCLTYIKL